MLFELAVLTFDTILINSKQRFIRCCKLSCLHVLGCLGGAVVRRQTRDRKVAGSTPGRGAIKSARSTQPSIPPG